MKKIQTLTSLPRSRTLTKFRLRKQVKVSLRGLGVLLALLAILIGPPLQVAHAAALTSKSDIMSSLKVSTASNHTIQFTTPTGVAAGETITVTFPAGWTLTSVVIGDVDLEDDTVDLTLAATCTDTTWGYDLTGQVITFTSCTGTIAAASVVAVKVGTVADTGSNQITNSATTGSHTISIGGTMADSGNIVVNLLTDDQVAATATVAESLSFSISNNSIAFGTLTTANARWANTTAGSATEVTAHTIVVGTNGTSGYTLTINGSTLTSGGNTVTAIGATAVASSPASEQYGIKASASGGTGTVSAPYATANYALDTAAFPDQLGSAAGASADTTYTLTYIANIASNTEAGSYTSTLTYTATATF